MVHFLRSSPDNLERFLRAAKTAALFLIGLSVLASCASSMPSIKPLDIQDAEAARPVCERVFPSGNWNLVHSIEATLAGGKKAFLTGVTRISGPRPTVRSIMMTLEGLVVFDAVFDGDVIVNRAVSPFDSAEFARRLMDDVRLLFVFPDAETMEFGETDAGETVCRCRQKDAMATDVIVGDNGDWNIRKYLHGELYRTIQATGAGAEKKGYPGISRDMELLASGTANYRLSLKLIDAESVREEN